MLVEDFKPTTSALNKGVTLIEASAGTGKTYTIAMLVLRLVVELGIPIEKVLVVTFTKAATEELKDRIRLRLAQARMLLLNSSATAPFDTNLSGWLDQLELTQDEIKRRLELALLDIDQAGIFTIHGFCQRVLSEHALASDQLFDADLTDDPAAIQQSCADDFWRRTVQNRPPWEAALLTRDVNTPDELMKNIKVVSEDTIIFPDKIDLEEALQKVKTLAVNVTDQLPIAVESIKLYLENNLFKSDFTSSFPDCCSQLTDWLTGNTLHAPTAKALNLFTYSGLAEALNGTQFKSNKNQTGEERKAGFLQSLNIDFTPFDDLAAAVQQITVGLRRNLLDNLQMELDKRLEQMNVWSFDNLITHLAKALQGNHAGQLTHELRERFAAALIDEFQDTDNNQWHIFSSLFATPSHYLVLVGDPKQAIYKFRGADIYSYLAAQKHAQHQFTLRQNWRSHPLLLEGVNRLFKKQNAFLIPDITFKPSESALSDQNGRLYENDIPLAPIVLWQVPESESKAGYWQANAAAEIIRTACVNEITLLLNGNFRLQPDGQKINPKDIAILVRENRHAKEFQDALRKANVPSVLTSTESAFKTNEAVQLHTLLEALAHPGDIKRLGQALSLDWFGYDSQSLYQLLNNETAIDSIATRFLKFNQIWQHYGVMSMMQTLLKQEHITSIIANSDNAERILTNLQHLLELLQQAVIDERLGIHKTLNWFKTEITRAHQNSSGSENRQLRLESDADAVKIVTMHRAKGLEYPIVFCPYLWQDRHQNHDKAPFVKCHAPSSKLDTVSHLIVDLGSQEMAKHSGLEKEEQRAEDIRLAYVAVTRAKYRCYIPWANVRSEKETNSSALASLLELTGQDFPSQQTTLQALQAQHPDIFYYELLDKTAALNGRYDVAKTQAQLSAKKRRRLLVSDWQMSSYTALSGLSIGETPELPTDKADESQTQHQDTSGLLPSGAHTGNVIHELLELVPFSKLAQKTDISKLRDKACQRYGLSLPQPNIIDGLLQKVVASPLSESNNAFCLMNLNPYHCLKEMPFYLSLPATNTSEINRILGDEPTFQPLTHKQMSGLLTGFIDLICQYDGRYYVMDYKTNTLPDYRTDTLKAAMREHNYGLQYWLYSVVLHLYLQNRLDNYRYEEHFGGVRYLFVRGMSPDRPMSGVFQDRPELEKLTALRALFKD